MLDKTEINGKAIKAVGISNQRETAMAWHRQTGKPVYRAIVWQCARGAAICEELRRKDLDSLIKNTTGLPLSPYFSAAKLAWILRHVEGAGDLLTEGNLCMGTMGQLARLLYDQGAGIPHRFFQCLAYSAL